MGGGHSRVYSAGSVEGCALEIRDCYRCIQEVFQEVDAEVQKNLLELLSSLAVELVIVPFPAIYLNVSLWKRNAMLFVKDFDRSRNRFQDHETELATKLNDVTAKAT